MAIISDRKFAALREAVLALQNGCIVDFRHAAITAYAKETYNDELALSNTLSDTEEIKQRKASRRHSFNIFVKKLRMQDDEIMYDNMIIIPESDIVNLTQQKHQDWGHMGARKLYAEVDISLLEVISMFRLYWVMTLNLYICQSC